MADKRNPNPKGMVRVDASKGIDARDIFEKALDFAAPVAGAYLGMRGGKRLFGGRAKDMDAAYRKAMNDMGKADDLRDIPDGQRNDTHEAAAKYFDDQARQAWRDYDQRSIGRLFGGAAGGFGGLISTGAEIQDAKKRRKQKR